MSTSVTKSVSCPNCGIPHEMEIFTSINGNDNPELKERILNEDLFDFRCDRCGYTCQITYPLVYHDPSLGYMTIMYAQGQSGYSAEPPKSLINVVKRKVDSLARLKEKILIFDSGFNDVAIELVKNALSGIITKTYQNPNVDCYFSKKEVDGSLEFAIFLDGNDTPVYHTIKGEVYEQSAEVLRALNFREVNDFLDVNCQLADELLNEYKEV